MKKHKLQLSTTHILLLSFLAAILIGTTLLCLPISSANHTSTPFVDSLFMATTSTCVTGLVVTPTFSSWSIFGQIVILCLIQLGGLGVITAMACVSVLLHRKLGLKDGLLLQDALNINTLSGLSNFIKSVVKWTFVVEGIGAVLYMPVFISDFGLRGIWISIFTSISAFCNAGIDIISANSLSGYVSNSWINVVTCSLIVSGGLGYIVWFDVVNLFKKKNGKRFNFQTLSLHSKIVLSATSALIFVGALLIFVFEYNNPLTIQPFSLFDKIQASFFQSITTRTAGFSTIPQENFTNSSSILCLLLMFIGGSPVGTAGGAKTVTLVVLAASAITIIRNKNDVELFNRRIAKQAIDKSIAVACMSFVITFASAILLSSCTNASVIDIFYETTSATATVGLTRNLTSSLNIVGKLIIIATMYLGRVGPISLAIAFKINKTENTNIRNPEEEISVG